MDFAALAGREPELPEFRAVDALKGPIVEVGQRLVPAAVGIDFNHLNRPGGAFPQGHRVLAGAGHTAVNAAAFAVDGADLAALGRQAEQAGTAVFQGGDIDGFAIAGEVVVVEDRKSTRLNSSHVAISYAVF